MYTIYFTHKIILLENPNQLKNHMLINTYKYQNIRAIEGLLFWYLSEAGRIFQVYLIWI